MHITTTAELTPDKKIVIQPEYQELLKSGMRLKLVIDQEDDKENQKMALGFVLNAAGSSSPGLKVKEVTRKWIHDNE